MFHRAQFYSRFSFFLSRVFIAPLCKSFIALLSHVPYFVYRPKPRWWSPNNQIAPRENANDILFRSIKLMDRTKDRDSLRSEPISLSFLTTWREEKGANSITSRSIPVIYPFGWTSFSISFTSLARKLVAFPFGTPAHPKGIPLSKLSVGCLLVRNIEFRVVIQPGRATNLCVRELSSIELLCFNREE